MLRSLILSSMLAAGPAMAADITLLSGKTSKGTLVAADAQFVSVKVGEDTQKIPVKDMATIDLGNKVSAVPPGTKFDEIELTDGSQIRHTEFKLKSKAVTVKPLPGGSAPVPALDLPMSSVFYLCRDAHDLGSRERWKKLLAGRGKRDLFVRQTDGTLDPEIGTILEGTETGDRIVFQDKDDQRQTILLTRATGGLVFNQPPPAVVPPTVCKVLDVAGNLLFAQSLTVEGSALTVKTVSGATVKYASLDAVAKLDFSSGNVAYLSDLEPTVTAPPAPADDPQYTPYIKDRAKLNEPLRLAGKVFTKGLWIAPETTLTYKLGGDYREFKAAIGIDDLGRDAGDNSTVNLTILADGRPVFAEKYTRKSAAKEVVLNMKEVKELRFVVTTDSPLFTGSHLDLADARFQK